MQLEDKIFNSFRTQDLAVSEGEKPVDMHYSAVHQITRVSQVILNDLIFGKV
jgi:hypothetical protein